MFPSVTHVVLGERNNNMQRGRAEREGTRERGEGVRIEKNNNRLCKRDKSRNKECIHERKEECEYQKG